jgi:hypothetical protein
LNYSISHHPKSQKFENFKQEIGKVLLSNYQLIEDFNFDWDEIEKDIKFPTEEELNIWIDK